MREGKRGILSRARRVYFVEKQNKQRISKMRRRERGVRSTNMNSIDRDGTKDECQDQNQRQRGNQEKESQREERIHRNNQEKRKRKTGKRTID